MNSLIQNKTHTMNKGINDYFLSIFFGLFSVYALYFLFTPNTGTDYLLYYLPVAEYLFEHHSFPEVLSYSVLDATYAYPPVESLILLLTCFFGDFQGVLIKFIHIGKLFVLFYMIYEVQRLYHLDRYIFSGFLICQPFLYFSGIYSTDLNVMMAFVSLTLLYKDNRWLKVCVMFLTYGLLSKYTFLIIYILALGVFIYKKRFNVVLWFLIPAVIFCLFLWKNYFLYNNPVFPVFENMTTWGQSSVSPTEFTNWYSLKENIVLKTIQGSLLGLIILVVIARPQKDNFIIWVSACTYYLAWSFMMNVDSAGQSARFLLPVTFLLFLSISSKDRDIHKTSYGYFLAILSAGFTLSFNSKLFITSLPIILWGILGLIPSRRFHWLIVLPVALVLVLRLASKGEVDFRGVGYDYYKNNIRVVNEYSQYGNFLTDFTLLPFSVREKESVDMDGSLLFGNWECVIQNQKCKEYKYLYFNKESYIWSNVDNNDYEEVNTDTVGYRLARRIK